MKFENPELVKNLNSAKQKLATSIQYLDAAKNHPMREKAGEIFEQCEAEVSFCEGELHYNSREGRAYRAQQAKAKK